ncbi:MAG: DUF4159 domain-containing protein [Limisphaerales bacterium]
MKKSFKNSCAFLCTLLLLAGSGSRIAAEPPAPAPGFAPTLASNQVKAVPVSASQGAGVRPDLTLLQCGNLIYNGNKSSVCFADRFLTDVAQQTSLRVNKKFCPVRLDAEALFDYPFCVMSGNENFTLNEKERRQLRNFLTQGGFLLASPGCSDEKWDKSFRQEIKVCFPEYPLEKIPMTHPVFSTVNPISRLTEKHGKPVMLEGLEINGRLVLVYSKEGLNDVEYAKGCCCCGGNEIQNPGKVNVNIFAYAVLY